MKINLVLITTLAVCVVFISACGSKQMKPSQKVAESHAEQKQTEGTVSLTPMQRKAIGLELGPLEKRNLSGTISVSGELTVPPQDEANVSAVLGGNVAKINVTEGERVQKGETIALLEHPDFIQMQVDLQKSSSRLGYLKQNYERLKNLYEKNVSSGKDVQQAKAEYLSTKAEAEGLKAKLRMLGLNVDNVLDGKIYRSIPVKAPIAGYIKSVTIGMGQHITPGDVLFEIVDNSNIHADLKVFEKEIFKVQEGQTVYFTVSNSADRQYTATIYSMGQHFETNPKAVRVHAKIEGSSGKLIQGMYINGKIAVSDTLTPALPETAIFGAGKESYIFIKTGETGKNWTFKRIPVSVGIRDKGWAAVNFFERLPNSAKIVYKGTYKLISELGKSERSHEG